MVKPVNRYVQITSANTETEESSSGILLPADFKPKESRHRTASVVSWADDVRFAKTLVVGAEIVIDNTMVEQIDTSAGQISVIQDNYVIAILSD
ncbi:MAG: hypothetical protein HOJ16_06645 [Candidatus Peribacter sp.]|jgi:co-chaperonin GroES (HSP10)|nr:hypothetical protein [Candidatus Peribacter sp.]MBT6056718.1 hypothetical protein [Gammaproteobacteria bacterium]MBT7338528.1 hypothetical protein [Candidatus Jacksonbacteria bacterium]MDB4307248.1 hypothetical protein [Akkermansiaceae bacterium]|tara:strand:+ start:34 stop:315 length:282 start_codon:yes stop_codon:yes gene_type:complete